MTPYSKEHPFLATIKERTLLSLPGSQKRTYHVVLDLSGSQIHYKVGDSCAIFPENDPEVVEEILKHLGASGEESVHPARLPHPLPLRQWLSTKANLARINRKLAASIATICPKAEPLLGPDAFRAYADGRQVVDLLADYAPCPLPLELLCDGISTLLPRFYSIASCQDVVGDEVHCTLTLVEYHTHGRKRHGVASHYLSERAPMHTAAIPLYLQPTQHFTLPPDANTPIIMIGPGTGVAPFVGFMQQRAPLVQEANSWLFFGEQHRACDFYYESFWMQLQEQKKLRLSTAFSRDQEHKIYVQHRLWEEREEIWQWVQEGAWIFVCGDASGMAKDVEQCLLDIFKECGSLDDAGAKDLLRTLRRDGRYLRDVY